MSSKSPVNRFVWKSSIFWENCIKLKFSGCPRKFYHRVMYTAPSSGHISLNCTMPFKLILRRFEVTFWCLEWECCTFERLVKLHSNSPTLYYGFKSKGSLWYTSLFSLFLIPYSFFFPFFHIGIGTNSQTILADTDIDKVKNWLIYR